MDVILNTVMVDMYITWLIIIDTLSFPNISSFCFSIFSFAAASSRGMHPPASRASLEPGAKVTTARKSSRASLVESAKTVVMRMAQRENRHVEDGLEQACWRRARPRPHIRQGRAPYCAEARHAPR